MRKLYFEKQGYKNVEGSQLHSIIHGKDTKLYFLFRYPFIGESV